MTDEKIIAYLQIGVVAVIAASVVIGYANYKHTEVQKPSTSFYFLAKDPIGRQMEYRVKDFIGPKEIRIDRVDNLTTNLYGWFTFTNRSGDLGTQWFRCTIRTDYGRKQVATELKFFSSDQTPPTAVKP